MLVFCDYRNNLSVFTAQHEPMLIQLLSPPYLGSVVYKAGPAQFGYDLKLKPAITGILQMVEPFKGCTEITNSERLQGKIALLERGECMFVDKVRAVQKSLTLRGCRARLPCWREGSVCLLIR